VKPWEVCPNCHQLYQNTRKVYIANEFVPFIERKHQNYQQKQVEVLVIKLWAFYNSQQPPQIKEAKEVTTRVLVLILEKKIETPMPPTQWMQ